MRRFLFLCQAPLNGRLNCATRQNNSHFNNFTNVRATTTTQSTYGSYFLTSSNNTLSNVEINKTGTASTYGLYWNGGEGNIIDRLVVNATVASTAKYGARFDTITSSTISNSRFYSRDLQAVWLAAGSNNNIFNNTTINTSTTSAAHGFYIDLSSGNSIGNSTINTTGVSIYILTQSGSTMMENLNIESSASSGIYVQGGGGALASDGNIINNVTAVALNYPLAFYQQSASNNVTNSTFNSSANTAFLTNAGSNGNLFRNNTFRSRLSGGTAYAMYFTSDSSNNVIRNNFLWSLTSHSVYFGSTSNSNSISNNSINASTGSGYGVYFAANPANSNNITNNRIVANGYGVYLNGDFNNVSSNNITSNGSGAAYLYTSNYNALEYNNITAVTNGYYLTTSTGNNITGSIVH